MSAAIAKAQIQSARNYTHTLLADLEPDDWFQMADGKTHIAWQCGHLAMAEYALTLLRVRSKLPEDGEFISSRFFKFFKKTSRPQPKPEDNPPVDEIRQVMDAVHAAAMREIDGYSQEVLQEELPEPYAVEATKLGSLYFCSAHEMLHAGQIGLIRRLIGKDPIR